MHSMHSMHSLLPSIGKRARRRLTSNFEHWHSAVLGGNAQPQSYTPSPKQCQLTDLPEMCARRAASATNMGTLWCGAADGIAIFLSVLRAGASRASPCATVLRAGATRASPCATCSRRYPGLDPFFFKVPRSAAFSQNLICACQASLRCCSLMNAGSHSTGIRVRAAGVLRDDRTPASCPVGAVGVASPADAIWTGHNSPSAVPRRRAARCSCQPPPAPPAVLVQASRFAQKIIDG